MHRSRYSELPSLLIFVSSFLYPKPPFLSTFKMEDMLNQAENEGFLSSMAGLKPSQKWEFPPDVDLKVRYLNHRNQGPSFASSTLLDKIASLLDD